MTENMFDDFFKEAQRVADGFINNNLNPKDCSKCKNKGKCNNKPNMEVSYEFRHYRYCDKFECKYFERVKE